MPVPQEFKAWLEQEGESVVLSREPGGSELGVEIRKILLSHSTIS
jgi:dTMP kinase